MGLVNVFDIKLYFLAEVKDKGKEKEKQKDKEKEKEDECKYFILEKNWLILIICIIFLTPFPGEGLFKPSLKKAFAVNCLWLADLPVTNRNIYLWFFWLILKHRLHNY